MVIETVMWVHSEEVMSSLDQVRPQQSYKNYLEINGWTSLFSCTADDAEAYQLELGTADLSGKCVLEVGFGSGSFLRWARDSGAHVAGSDIIDDLVVAASAADFETVSAEIAVAAAENRSRFDLIAAFDVFEHLSKQEILTYLRCFEEMLKVGGEAILRFPNGQSPFGLPLQHGDATHRTALAPMHFTQFCTGTRLEVVYQGRSKLPTGRFGARKIVRLARLCVQTMIESSLRFIYGYAKGITLAPTVTIRLRKKGEYTSCAE
jgi:2-polyprenyl-3-methyl-5-hydroxy-6-metoxy-1,4-benzoquinol methylase